ncbi:MAG: LacI family DNA-binding transcriptional regulator [Cyclobacteriaceae bacterium]
MTLKKTSLNDIALKLGVSKTLVSLVLNGKARENRISEELIGKVEQVARELNYKPNQMARGLRLGKSHTLGLIVADISNQFFGRISRAIEDEAERHGYTMIFCSSDEAPQRLEKQIAILRDKQVDGLIITPTEGSEAMIKQLQEDHFPFVLLDRYISGLSTPSVTIDNYKAAFQGVSHLFSQGYKKVAYINYALELAHFSDRLHGYTEAHLAQDMIMNPDLVCKVPFIGLEDAMEAVIQQLLDKEVPDAIFFANGRIGLVGLQALLKLNVKIPDDLGIVSFDDNETFGLSYVPVSCIAQPIDNIGRKAFTLLYDLINSESILKKEQSIKLDGELILRKSSLKHIMD